MSERKVIVIAGGTGSVGEGLVKSFLEAGWQVVVPGRSSERLAALRAHVGEQNGLRTIVADLSEPAGVDLFVEQYQAECPPADVFVASLGGWRQGIPLAALSWREWQDTLRDNLSSHFLAMQAGMKLLKSEGVYVHINGLGAEAVIPTAGPTTAAAAAQHKLVQTLAAEQRSGGRRIFELMLGLVNTRQRNVQGPEAEHMINPMLIGMYIRHLESGQHVDRKQVHHYLRDASAVKLLVTE